MDNFNKITPKGIKREARGLLANKWSRALGALSIYLMVIVLFVQIHQLVTSLLSEYGPAAAARTGLDSFGDYLAYYTSGTAGMNLLLQLALVAFYFILSAPLSLGITYWYRKLTLLENIQVGQIFHYYQSNDLFFSAVIFQALHTVIRLAFAIVSFLPSAVCLGIAYGSGNRSMPLIIASAVLALIGLLVYGALSLRFFFAKYLFCGEYGYDAMDCLRYSAKYMKGHIGSVLGVVISFVGWFLSCVLILPLAYVIPFYNASMAACAQDIIDAHMGETIEKLMEAKRR